MSTNNAFFKISDPRITSLYGMEFPMPAFWNRSYEYPWALGYTRPNQIVADMGCGRDYRPFKDALADICGIVYAVDEGVALLRQPRRENMVFLVADITKVSISAASLDRIFCISVLEDTNYRTERALLHFARLLKPDGLIVATFDVHYDTSKPLGRYPGVNWDTLPAAMSAAGLEFVGDVDTDKTNAVYHEEYNLACFHAVMRLK
jgi:SAM-dependent methyltransferase